jgi:hypothetical protein
MIISNRIIPQTRVSKKLSKTEKPVKQAIIHELLIWKNNISQPIYFIKHYIYFISFAYPNMLKNIFLVYYYIDLNFIQVFFLILLMRSLNHSQKGLI